MFDVCKWALACICVALLTKQSLAEEVVLVVDPKGKSVQSDIVRSEPAPKTPLGRTDATGRLALSHNCVAGYVLLAQPPIDYVAHGSTCTGQRGGVKIEVTQRFVIATLESNLEAAQRAANPAAIAQIAGELSERVQFENSAKALHYKNVSTVALANTFAHALNEPSVTTSGPLAERLVWDPAKPQPWTQICKDQRVLLKCRGGQPKSVELEYTDKLESALKQDPDAPREDAHGARTNDWLQKYSGQQKEALLYQNLSQQTLRVWTTPASPQG
jgi:hypothetical protein